MTYPRSDRCCSWRDPDHVLENGMAYGSRRGGFTARNEAFELDTCLQEISSHLRATWHCCGYRVMELSCVHVPKITPNLISPFVRFLSPAQRLVTHPRLPLCR